MMEPRDAATLGGLGFAEPPGYAQHELVERCAATWKLSEGQRAFLDRVVAGSGIARRHGVRPVEAVAPMTTAERMHAFDVEAPPLAARAALDAVADAEISARDITDVVVVTCTGFSSPGVGPSLVRLLGLRPEVRQTQIGFMGCFGGIVGLRTAAALASADAAAVVLVVCVELCSLHIRRDTAPDQIVAASLFGDGVAAAIVSGAATSGRYGAIGLGRSLLLGEASGKMTWKILDDGFAMTLARDVPTEIEAAISGFVGRGDAAGLAIHPGGASIIDAIGRAVPGVDPVSVAASRAVLRDYGNMSSGSVMYVLADYLRRGGSRPVELIAFGPGLTIDAVVLR